MDATTPPPSPDEVRDELCRVLDTPPFRSAARQRQFLSYVVEESLQGRADGLKEWSIARSGLGEPTSFDPRTDPLVRVLAGRVRSSLARYYDGPGASDAVMIGIPKGSYVATFTWADDASSAPDGATVGPSLAVLSFGDLTPELQPPYFAAGFTESLVVALSRFQGVPIIGPLSSPEPDEGVDAIAHRAASVGADLALIGTLRTVGDITRLGVRLIDVHSAATRWSATFEDRTSPDHPFDIEDRVTERIGALIADPLGVISLAGPSTPRTSDPEVYRAMLAYYAYARSLDQRLEAEVVEGLERAHRREPQNPTVMAMLAATLLFHGVGDVGGRPASPEESERAIALAQRSDQLAPGNPLASLVLAFRRLLEGDPDGCRTRLRAVLASSSHSPTFRSMCGIGLLLSGAWDDGIAHLRPTLELNPNHPPWQHGFLCLDDLVRGDAASALEEARLVDTPGLVWGPLLRAASYGALGDRQRGADELAQLDPRALASAMDHDWFFSHTHLPPEVTEALTDGLAGLAPSS